MRTDTLLNLIQSLNSKEKADFKKYVRYNSGKRIPDYELLYDTYNKILSPNLTEEVLLEKLQKYLKKKPSVQKNLANIRMQLKERLLESLVLHWEGKNNKQALQKAISIIEILINRKLYGEAILKIKQARKHAITYDLSNLMIEVIDLEILLLGKNSTKNDFELLEKLTSEQDDYRHLSNIELQLRNTFCQVNLIADRDIQMSKKTSKILLEKLIKDSVLRNVEIKKYERQNRIHIVEWYYRIKNLYHRSIGENKIAHKNSKALITYFESDMKLLKHFESNYVKALCSYTRTCFLHYKTKELEESIKKVQSIYNTKKNFTALEATCDMGILCYLRTCKFEKALEISEFMDQTWKELELKIEDGKLLWYIHTNTLLHWIYGNTKNFKEWLKKGLRNKQPNKGKNFYFGIRFFELMQQIDNNELLDLKEKVEAFQKTLQNNEHLTDFEKLVLGQFRAFYNIEFSNKNINLKQTEKAKIIQQNFQSLKKELLALKFKNPPINYGEILIWCESHLQNKTIKEVFEQQK